VNVYKANDPVSVDAEIGSDVANAVPVGVASVPYVPVMS
jgi:hypothetical protein